MKYFKRPFISLNLAVIITLLLFSPLFIFDSEALAQDSSVANFLFGKGKTYYEEGNYSQALRELEKALLVQPGHPQASMYIENIKEKRSLSERGIEEVPFFEDEITREETVVLLPPSKAKSKIVTVKLAEELSALETIKQSASDEYVLGVGDGIEIVVWRHGDLSRAVAIRPDGMISFPLAGEIKVAGLTPQEVGEIITLKLTRYVRDPKVSIIVTAFKKSTILILGEVGSPGVYDIFGRLTVLEAIAGAGSYNKYAKLRSTLIVREGYSGNPEIIRTDLLDVMLKGKFENDIVLRPGDIVYLPQKFITQFADVMRLFNTTIKPAADTYLRYQEPDLFSR